MTIFSIILVLIIYNQQKNILIAYWSLSYFLYFAIHHNNEMSLAAQIYIWITYISGLIPLLGFKFKLAQAHDATSKFILKIGIILYTLMLPINYFLRENSHNRLAINKSALEIVIGQVEIALTALLIVYLIKLRNAEKMFSVFLIVLVANSVVAGSKGAALQMLLCLSILILCCTDKNFLSKIAKKFFLMLPAIFGGFVYVLYKRIETDRIEVESSSFVGLLHQIFMGRLNFIPILEKVLVTQKEFEFFSDFTNLKLIATGFVPSFLIDRPEVNLGRYFARDIGLNNSMQSYVAMSYPIELYINFTLGGAILVFAINLSQRIFISSIKNTTLKTIFLLYTPMFVSFEMNIAAGITRQGKVVLTSMFIIFLLILLFQVMPKRKAN